MDHKTSIHHHNLQNNVTNDYLINQTTMATNNFYSQYAQQQQQLQPQTQPQVSVDSYSSSSTTAYGHIDSNYPQFNYFLIDPQQNDYASYYSSSAFGFNYQQSLRQTSSPSFSSETYPTVNQSPIQQITANGGSNSDLRPSSASSSSLPKQLQNNKQSTKRKHDESSDSEKLLKTNENDEKDGKNQSSIDTPKQPPVIYAWMKKVHIANTGMISERLRLLALD